MSLNKILNNGVVVQQDNDMLFAPLSMEKFRKALFQMHSDKAHGQMV